MLCNLEHVGSKYSTCKHSCGVGFLWLRSFCSADSDWMWALRREAELRGDRSMRRVKGAKMTPAHRSRRRAPRASTDAASFESRTGSAASGQRPRGSRATLANRGYWQREKSSPHGTIKPISPMRPALRYALFIHCRSARQLVSH